VKRCQVVPRLLLELRHDGHARALAAKAAPRYHATVNIANAGHNRSVKTDAQVRPAAYRRPVQMCAAYLQR